MVIVFVIVVFGAATSAISGSGKHALQRTRPRRTPGARVNEQPPRPSADKVCVCSFICIFT
jgi:hypothetical protein